MKKCLFFLVFMSIYSVFSQEQSDSASINLQKYWYYRWRFQNDFVMVGEGQGKSLPIQSRKGVRWVQDIEVVDATIFLGFYWAVLATENKLLRINQRWEDLEKNKTELYYALKAFERLDKVGETFLGKEAKIDGYFMRDDIPCNFIDSIENRANYEHFNQQKTIPKGTTPVCKVMTSDFCSEGKTTLATDVKNLPEMSQDQVIWLMMGALFIAKSLPEGKDSVTLDNGKRIEFDFVEETKRFATNIINYCRFAYPNNPKKENWTIYNPLGNKVYPGQNVFMFKYPLSVIGKTLYTPTAENNQPFNHLKGKFQWNLTRVFIPYKNVNSQMIMILATLSDEWGKNTIKTRDKIYKLGVDNHWDPFYLMMLDYLHDTPIDGFEVESKTEKELNTAPACGPYLMNRDIFKEYTEQQNFPPYTYLWSANLKFSRQIDGLIYPEHDIYTYRGFFNGLDYMLLFNLYYLTSHKPLPKYENLIDRVITESDSVSTNYHAFNSIENKNGNQLKINNVRFSPWTHENILNNNYGWQEKFPLVNHFLLIQNKLDE